MMISRCKSAAYLISHSELSLSLSGFLGGP